MKHFEISRIYWDQSCEASKYLKSLTKTSLISRSCKTASEAIAFVEKHYHCGILKCFIKTEEVADEGWLDDICVTQ